MIRRKYKTIVKNVNLTEWNGKTIVQNVIMAEWNGGVIKN
jgi:hypothetical protein